MQNLGIIKEARLNDIKNKIENVLILIAMIEAYVAQLKVFVKMVKDEIEMEENNEQ